MARSELALRVLFAVVAIPVVIAAALVGDWALAALLSVAAALAAWEFARVAMAAGYRPLGGACVVLAALLPLYVHAVYLGLAVPSISLGAVIVLGIFGAVIWARGAEQHPVGAAATTVLGVVYTGGMLSFAYALRYHGYAVGARAGAAVLLLPVVLTWTSDIAGYTVGRAVGRHRLAPAVSPGKTVEGAVGGLLLCVVVAWLYQRLVLIPAAQLALPRGALVVFALAIAAAAQVGDLAESLMKREAGVKDSSRIIPGHGGVLDRIDGLLFALPVAYVLFGMLVVPVPAVSP
ncbi:MAG TPA: CDP-archaeol synthase [Gemmatimonadaceae bacterium]|nr:CDP-archaeol synthase [Gemmatimonadaceae bacterium]